MALTDEQIASIKPGDILHFHDGADKTLVLSVAQRTIVVDDSGLGGDDGSVPKDWLTHKHWGRVLEKAATVEDLESVWS